MGSKKKAIEQRFWQKVHKTDTCWNWIGCKTEKGYGQMRIGRTIRAHRYSWVIHNGPIPNNMFVCHRCDNPSCVRPNHLFLGTAKDNTLDMISKHRQCGARGETHPFHKLTNEDIPKIRSSSLSCNQLAMQYGVSSVLINSIKLRKRWTHIT
jgi:hypothetical protein